MYTLKDILRLEVAPALGCTESAAVALCTASARSLINVNEFDSIDIEVDSNIYKNGMGVAIPGAEGVRGIDIAAALGIICGKPEMKLEVLDNVNQQFLKKAEELVRDKKISVKVLENKKKIYIRCRICSGDLSAEAVIENLHDNLTLLRKNGKEVTEHPLLSKTEQDKNEVAELESWLKKKNLKDLIALLDTIDDDDLEFIEKGLQYNLKLANHGLTYGTGLGVGKTLERLTIENLLKKDMILSARILTSAAADARMSGVKMPAMSSSGSGNHGLTAILPIWAVKDYLNQSDSEKVYKAIALSHIITAYIKAFTGRLSAICGCSVAAGAGASAGITYLMGGNVKHIADAIKNLISDLAGVICDGAKNSCALKLATAAGTAVQSALFSLHGIDVKGSDGIVGYSPEQTMKNIGKLSVDGMVETDRIILQIMIEKQFSQDKEKI